MTIIESGGSASATTRASMTFVSDASGSAASGFFSYSVFPLGMSMTTAAFPAISMPAKGSAAGAAAVWLSEGTLPARASAPETIRASAISASTEAPAMRARSLCIGADSIFRAWSVRLFERGEFGGDCSILGQFFPVLDAELREKLDRGAVEVFARVFRILRAFEEAAREQGAQGRGSVDAADVVYARARRGAQVEYDGEDFEPGVADVALKFAFLGQPHGFARLLRDREACGRIRPHERDAAPLQALRERVERRPELFFFAFEEQSEFFMRQFPSLAEEEGMRARGDVVSCRHIIRIAERPHALLRGRYRQRACPASPKASWSARVRASQGSRRWFRACRARA